LFSQAFYENLFFFVFEKYVSQIVQMSINKYITIYYNAMYK